MLEINFIFYNKVDFLQCLTLILDTQNIFIYIKLNIS